MSTVLTNKKIRVVHSSFLLFLTIFILSTIGCEGPAGVEGPQGPVGPAGENGSVIHAGNGAPDESMGAIGDYYLNKSTAELYGPKTEEGWGTPIKLAGEDGEDGSQIFAGTTTPDPSLGNVGDYYLNTATYDLYGPKTGGGWGTPINLQGNANVQSFDLVVKKADWSSVNFHYGGNNNYRFYKIPADSTGGTTVSDFYNAGNAVLAYARLLSEGGYQAEHLNVKQLPLLTTVNITGMGEVGLRIQLSPTRSEFLLNRTTNGWDSESVLDEQVPPTVEFRLVFIEASNIASKNAGGEIILLELKAAGVDLDDYYAVMDYFGAAY